MRLQKVDPIARLAAAALFITAIAFVPHGAWLRFLGGAVVLASCAVVAGISLRRLIRPFLYLESFAFGIAVLSLFQPDGLSIFLSVLAKSSLCAFCVVLFAATTSFSGMLSTLTRLRVSSLLVITLALAYRYAFLLSEESERLQRARRSRTFAPSRFELWNLLARDISQLLIKASRRGKRIYDAMCARGWKV